MGQEQKFVNAMSFLKDQKGDGILIGDAARAVLAFDDLLREFGTPAYVGWRANSNLPARILRQKRNVIFGLQHSVAATNSGLANAIINRYELGINAS